MSTALWMPRAVDALRFVPTVSSSTGSSAAALRMNATGPSTLRGLNFKLLEDRCCVLVPEHIKDASHFAVSDRLRKCPTPVQRRQPFEDRHTRDCHVICSVPQNEQADALGPTETRWITPTSGGAVTVNIHPDPIEKTRAKQFEKVSFFFHVTVFNIHPFAISANERGMDFESSNQGNKSDRRRIEQQPNKNSPRHRDLNTHAKLACDKITFRCLQTPLTVNDGVVCKKTSITKTLRLMSSLVPSSYKQS